MSQAKQSKPAKPRVQSCVKLPASFFKRDLNNEKSYGITDMKFYGYFADNYTLKITCEIFADGGLKKDDMVLVCTLYDIDDDIIKYDSNNSAGWTSRIYAVSFFDGFPAIFEISGIKMDEVKSVRITPSKY